MAPTTAPTRWQSPWGSPDVRDLYEQGRRIAASLKAREPLSRADWTRALLATEIVFASDVLGTGVEWATVTGRSDAETIALLREIQRGLYKAQVIARPGHHPI